MAGRLLVVVPVAVLAIGCGTGAERAAQPVPRSPVWQRATPEAAGIDAHALDALDLKGVTSVLVARHGRLVIERYRGIRPADRVPVFSITKSVVSALVGIALAEGRLRSVDEPLEDIIPGADPRITLRHLLSMSAGYGRGLGYGSLDASTLADRPLVSEPGATFRYDGGSSQLLAAVVARVTGMTAAAYARDRLFEPLGIYDVQWPGSHGDSGIILGPRDLMAFGQLYLSGGVWRGKRIVPAAWVRASTRPQIDIAADPGGATGFGYDWWLQTRSERSFAARGYLGQIVAVFPRLDEVVVVTSSGERFSTPDVVRAVVKATSP